MAGGPSDKLIIGRRERVSFPDWGIERVLAKVDSGARTSALHVGNIVDLPGDRVRFEVVLSRADPDQRVPVEADLSRVTRVRPSTGTQHRRHVVTTRIRIGPVEREIEVSLVCRAKMLCRMLLGRTALEGVLIDVSRKHILSTRTRAGRKGRK
jgi:hypothetical protein